MQNGPLGLEGQVKESPAVVEHPVDLLLRDTMIHNIRESDFVTCFVELITDLLPPLRMNFSAFERARTMRPGHTSGVPSTRPSKSTKGMGDFSVDMVITF